MEIKQVSAFFLFIQFLLLFGSVCSGHLLDFSTRGEEKCPLKCGKRLFEEDRVFGGTIVEEDLWPWTFLLSASDCDGNITTCTAQYIGSDYFVTSAHCLYTDFYFCRVNRKKEKKPTMVEYEVDKLTLTSRDETYNVEEFWIDSRFDQNDNSGKNYAFDIGVIKSSSPVSAEPVCLASRLDPAKDAWGHLVGFGAHHPNSEWDRKLRHAIVNLASKTLCKLKWGNNAKLCTGSENSGALVGDSGAALLTGHLPSNVYFAQGLLSHYRPGSNRKMNPEIYAPIADLCGFIASSTGAKVHCIDPYSAEIKSKCKKAIPEGSVDA